MLIKKCIPKEVKEIGYFKITEDNIDMMLDFFTNTDWCTKVEWYPERKYIGTWDRVSVMPTSHFYVGEYVVLGHHGYAVNAYNEVDFNLTFKSIS